MVNYSDKHQLAPDLRPDCHNQSASVVHQTVSLTLGLPAIIKAVCKESVKLRFSDKIDLKFD